MSLYDMVVDFTTQTYRGEIPSYPSKMTVDQLTFLTRMIVSEMFEMYQTVYESHDFAKNMLLVIFERCVVHGVNHGFHNLKSPLNRGEISPLHRDQINHIFATIICDLIVLYRYNLGPSIFGDARNLTIVAKWLSSCLNTDVKTDFVMPSTDEEKVAEQVDAIVDILYYTMNACAKHGFIIGRNFDSSQMGQIATYQNVIMNDLINYILRFSHENNLPVSKVFCEVHNANMAKRDPKTGRFTIRDDGKVMKPEGWKAPDVYQIIWGRPNDVDFELQLRLEDKRILEQTLKVLVEKLNNLKNKHSKELELARKLKFLEMTKNNSNLNKMCFFEIPVEFYLKKDKKKGLSLVLQISNCESQIQTVVSNIRAIILKINALELKKSKQLEIKEKEEKEEKERKIREEREEREREEREKKEEKEQISTLKSLVDRYALTIARQTAEIAELKMQLETATRKSDILNDDSMKTESKKKEVPYDYLSLQKYYQPEVYDSSDDFQYFILEDILKLLSDERYTTRPLSAEDEKRNVETENIDHDTKDEGISDMIKTCNSHDSDDYSEYSKDQIRDVINKLDDHVIVEDASSDDEV